jgi:hypothetical protein
MRGLSAIDSPQLTHVLLVIFQSAMKTKKAFYRAVRLTLIFLLIFIIFTPFSIVNAGERGVLIQFGEVQVPKGDQKF